MNARLAALFVCVVAASGATAADDAAAAPHAAAAAGLTKMEGVWRVVSGEEDGAPSAAYLVEHLKWEFKGDRLTFDGLQPLTDKAGKLSVKLDPSTTPGCIDLKVETGSLKDSVLEGVYEWKGDELRVCLYVGTDRNRPVEFETRAGSNRVLFVLKRDKP